MEYHIPVLLKEVIEFLNIKENLWYVDATLGGGGHTREILLGGGNVIGIDVDGESIRFVEEHFKNYVGDNRLILVNRNFTEIEDIVQKICRLGPAGILFDLGLSSYQLKDSSRGFSFNSESGLDMRMSKGLAVTAKDLVNGLSGSELELVFSRFGEEAYAGRIARRILEVRKTREIKTCRDLSGIVLGVKGHTGFGKVHPATKVFQALRIVVNDELGNLSKALPRAFRVLAPKGRMVVISFHSLEDRIVKDFGKSVSGLKVLTRSPVVPSALEVSGNKRARSAKLRAFEKI